jgi:hypothetical protein
MMKKRELIISAQKLEQVNEKYVFEYTGKRDALVEIMNKKMASRSDIFEMVGKNNLEMMKDNHANHARFLESIFHKHSPEILVDTIIWVFRAYRSRNFSSTYWAAQINTWIEIYRKELSPECFNAIYPYYKWIQINIPMFNELAEENLEAPNSAH